MTKDYHITPERAEEIWSEVEINQGFPADLAAFANAVLDEVLGEPILFASPQYEKLLEHHNGHTLCAGKKSELHTLALYAPRREK